MAAQLILARGGRPVFKPIMCAGDWPEYTPPYTLPAMPNTPPFNSHADGAYGQGYLNLHFPLVPDLGGSDGHVWMQEALKGVTAVGDIILTNWVPSRSFISSLYFEVTRTDKMLDGVYIKPIARRVKPVLAGRKPAECCSDVMEFTLDPVTDFDTDMATAGISKFPLGTPADDDALYGLAVMATDPAVKPSTFGHNILRKKADNSVEPLDDYFGEVLIGYEVVEGDPEKIASIWRSNIAVYLSAKLMAFEGASQIG